MTEKKIQAVLFDIGETLLSFGKVDVIALFREGGKLAHNYLKKLGQPAGLKSLFLLKYLWIIRIFRVRSFINHKDFDSLELLKKIGQKKGIKLTEQQWQEFGWCWYEPLSKLAKIEPDIKQTLQKLKNMGIKLGILSNTFINAATLEKHLANAGILDFFTTKLYSYQFDFKKPDSRIFLEAAKHINCRPENILFVGDRLNIDIAGALAVNMQAVMKKAYTNSHKKTPENVIKIERLAELPEVIEQLNRRAGEQ